MGIGGGGRVSNEENESVTTVKKKYKTFYLKKNVR